MPPITLDEDAVFVLMNYRWPGNIRQLKNITEQISVIEEKRSISSEKLKQYLPSYDTSKLPALYKPIDEKTFSSEREILYKVLFDMKKDMNDLKRLVHEIIEHGDADIDMSKVKTHVLSDIYNEEETRIEKTIKTQNELVPIEKEESNIVDTEEIVEESLSLVDKEIELIKKALSKHRGKRKNAALELGISERTLYRKIKEYDIES